MKNNTKISISIFILTLIFLIGIYLGLDAGIKIKTKIVHVNFEYSEPDLSADDWKYDFLEKDISDYIVDLSGELGIDPDLVVSFLLVENPTFNWESIHRNSNGTLDLGAMQLNDKYLYQTFLKSYWDMDIEFDPFNPKMNIFVAAHHIQYLQESLKIMNDVIAAYNCGQGAVMRNQIPESTQIYVKKVINNYTLLKNGEQS